MTSGVGERFQEETKYVRGKIESWHLTHIPRPPPYKEYHNLKRIKLPQPQKKGGSGIWETIQRRRSVRDFKDESITIEELSQLLWASQGITGGDKYFSFRAAPSAGALYPVETYLVVNAVRGIEKGVYHYGVVRHELEMLKYGDMRKEIVKASLGQEMVGEANVVFVWTAIFNRAKWKYKERAYRYVYLDAGHICQNLLLAAVSLGLGSCPVAAFYDHEVNAIIDVDGKDESTIYLCALGKIEKK